MRMVKLWIVLCLALPGLIGCGGGSPLVPLVQLSAPSLMFGTTLLGQGAGGQSITVKNVGIAALSFGSIAIAGANSSDFVLSGNQCGSSLAVNATCTVSVQFTPTAVGTRSATLILADNANGSPQTISLSGTGAAPGIGLSAASLTFPGTAVGANSAAQTVVVTNTGNAILVFTGIDVSGTNPNNFVQNNDCGTSLVAGSTCSIQVNFSPSAGGARSATLDIASNTTSQTVTLSGTGLAPVVMLNSSTLTFPTTDVDSTSAAQSVTVTNTGSADLVITSISLGGANPGAFIESSACPSTLAPQAFCMITGKFNPTATGSFSAVVNIKDNVSPSPQTVTFTGTGVAPIASLNSISVTFPATLINTTSTQTITVTNTGTGPLNVSGVSLGGANASSFSIASNTCTLPVAIQASCTVTLQFAPLTAVTFSATLAVTDNAPNSPQTVVMSGAGTAPIVNLNPTALTFPATNVGSISGTLTIMLTNTGNGNLVLNPMNPITLLGSGAQEFILQGTTCSTAVAPSSSCTISMECAPLAASTFTATVNIMDNAANSPQSFTVSGTGLAPSATLSTSNLTFEATGVGSTSSVQTVALTNSGNEVMNISSIAANGVFKATTCGSTLAPNATCVISVTLRPPCTGNDTFTPGSPVRYAGMLTITDNAPNSPQTVSLAGTGLSSATADVETGKVLLGADGHRDKGFNYSSVNVCQQIADLHSVFGMTPNTIFYRAWDSVHDYSPPADNPSLSIPADIQQMQAAGILPIVGAIVDPPSLPGGAIVTTLGATYSDGYDWAYALAKSDAQAAPTNVYWFVGNEWGNLVVGSGAYPSNVMDPVEWRKEPNYQPALGALAGAIQAIRDIIPEAKLISGVNDGRASLGLTLALAQDLQAKGLHWDYTNLHWGDAYVSGQTKYSQFNETPADFYGLNAYNTTLYNAFATLAGGPTFTGVPLFIDEYGSSDGNNTTTVSTANDAAAGRIAAQLLTDFVAHAPASNSEKGILAANYYQLYPREPSTNDDDQYLYSVTGGVSTMSGQGIALLGTVKSNPLTNSGAPFTLTASSFSIASPGKAGTSTIGLVPGIGFASGMTVTLTCTVWSEAQTSPTLNPTCNFNGQPSATVSITSMTSTLTVSAPVGAAVRDYVVTVVGSVAGASTDVSRGFALN